MDFGDRFLIHADGMGSGVRRTGPRVTARLLILHALSHVIRSRVAAPVTEHCCRKSIAGRLNTCVNWVPGSAHGMVICLMPCWAVLQPGNVGFNPCA